jgi:hypothetical protein
MPLSLTSAEGGAEHPRPRTQNQSQDLWRNKDHSAAVIASESEGMKMSL